jgi:hypothetical protein
MWRSVAGNDWNIAADAMTTLGLNVVPLACGLLKGAGAVHGLRDGAGKDKVGPL